MPNHNSRSRRKVLWSHPSKKNIYRGEYATTRREKRVFTLVPISGGGKPITFESWQEAKKNGWKKDAKAAA